jgi:hypothetical protein
METIADSWDSGAADREVYESCSEQDFRILAQHECPDLSSGNIVSALAGDHSELPIRRAYYKRRAWLSATMHGRDRATKHEHQVQGKKDFADHLCFHISYPMRVFLLGC